MAAPLLKRKRIVGIKVEATPGTAESLTASECTIPAYDAVAQPSIEIEARPKNGSLSQQAGVAGQGSERSPSRQICLRPRRPN